MDVVEQIRAANAGRDPQRLALKYTAMRADTLLASAMTDADERVAVAVLHLKKTREFMCVAFARDSAGRWRGFERSVYFPSVRAAEEAISRDFGRQLLAKTPAFAPLPGQLRGIDLFAAIDGVTRYEDAYILLRDGFSHAAAKQMLQEMRGVDDKIVYELNLAVPTTTFAGLCRNWRYYGGMLMYFCMMMIKVIIIMMI